MIIRELLETLKAHVDMKDHDRKMIRFNRINGVKMAGAKGLVTGTMAGQYKSHQADAIVRRADHRVDPWYRNKAKRDVKDERNLKRLYQKDADRNKS